MPQLFRTSTGKQVLASVLPDEKFVVDLKESLQTAYKGNLPSLAQFLKLFDAQLPRLKIDQAEWMAEFNDEENPSGVLELQKQVEKHMGEEKEVNKQVPETRQVGMCDVSMSDVRKLLAAKHSKIVDAALDLILTRYREMASDCARGYQSIITQLQKQATNVEELTAAKEYLQGLPSELAKLEVEAKGVMKAFDVLEHFRVRVASDDVHQRWRCYSGPKNVDTQIIASELDWAKLEKSFLDEMNEEQQDFDERLNDLTDTINTFSQYSDLNKIEEYYENVLFVNERLAQAFVETKKFNSRETLFNAEPTDYSRLSQLQKSWDPFANLWSIAKKWLDSKDKWLNEDFNAIDEKDLESMVSNGVRQLFKVVKDLKNLDPETTVGILGIAENIKQQLDDFKPYVPLVVGLRNSGMRERHWEEVSTMMKSPVNPEIENFCLQHFIDLGMVQKVEELSDIGDRSGKEFQIEKQLAAMKEAWGPIVFDCSEQYRTTETWILKGSDEVSALLDEQVVVVQAMQFSPFNKPFKDDIDAYADTLMYVSDTLENWLKVQRAWMYLQPIFDSPDIVKQLPQEAKKFKSVDTQWRGVMFKVSKNPNCLEQLSQDGLLEKWIVADRDLEAVQKGLEDYLEMKRGGFARFYFLSNDELLEILSQAKDPTRVQPFLCKVFEAIDTLTFEEDNSVNEMVSKEGEALFFVETMHTAGKQVEAWMTEVEFSMIECVRKSFENAVVDYPMAKYDDTANVKMDRVKWVVSHPGQCVLNGSQCHWTAEVEDAITTGRCQEYFELSTEQLFALVARVRSKTTRLERTTIGALVVIDVHAKDTVENLAKEQITSVDAFEWVSQLRFYWEKDDSGRENAWVRMVQTSFPYGYEYLGNSFRLVITPLTDKCYMTLMGAQNLNLGGAPAGPAGTGKTETTKDLAKALAKQCVVFNCSPEMDYIMVGKFFKGLASCGRGAASMSSTASTSRCSRLSRSSFWCSSGRSLSSPRTTTTRSSISKGR
jgi:dynein heavy chain